MRSEETPFYTTITRTVDVGEVPPKKGLHSIDRGQGIGKADTILEFCKVPRSGQEIIEFLGLEYRQYSWVKYIKPLLESGRLKIMLPKYESNRNQRYINAEVQIAISTDEAILEYCKTPRRKKEIREHFGLKIFQIKSHIDPLIADDRLRGMDSRNPQNHQQRYVNVMHGAPDTDNEIILDFCNVPRSREEIAGRLNIDMDKMCGYTQPLVDSGNRAIFSEQFVRMNGRDYYLRVFMDGSGEYKRFDADSSKCVHLIFPVA